MTEPLSPTTQPCNGCQAGQMHLQYLTYYTWMADELITVPNFPAWICDVCGKREYDPRALNQLNLLLSPSAGHPTSRRPSKRLRRPGSKTTRPTLE
jgi:YgiT-type zinc finger domain-containing protein